MAESQIETKAGEGNTLPSWRFHVENLGCIKSGDFEVKPLTLLCGPNNTGKTWAMYALYGFLGEVFGAPPVLPEIDHVIEEVVEKGIYSWDFGTWLEAHADEVLALINQGMKQRLPDIFNAPEPLFANSQFDWIISREAFVQSVINRDFNLQMTLGSKNYYTFHLLKPTGESKLQITILKIPLHIETTASINRYLSFLLSYLLYEVNDLRVFLMPAERNGLHLFYKELAYKRTALLHPSTRADFSLENISHYARPIADYIDWLNKVPELLKWKSGQCQDLARQVEVIAGGNYAVDSDGNVSFTPEKNDGEKLDLHLSSSTVKSLFGLWFYLEHEAKPGDTLMIDEPELNLHPANQRAVARLLARLVNAGLRVVVSTHSDYIVREINSLIMLNQPHPKRAELMRRFGYSQKEVLNPEKVACHLFDQSTIKAMDITLDEGILASTFDETIHDLNDTSDGIYYTYRDKSEEDAG